MSGDDLLNQMMAEGSIASGRNGPAVASAAPASQDAVVLSVHEAIEVTMNKVTVSPQAIRSHAEALQPRQYPRDFSHGALGSLWGHSADDGARAMARGRWCPQAAPTRLAGRWSRVLPGGRGLVSDCDGPGSTTTPTRPLGPRANTIFLREQTAIEIDYRPITSLNVAIGERR